MRVASPSDFYGTPWAPRSGAPKLGQHTRELLASLGRSEAEIDALDRFRCRRGRDRVLGSGPLMPVPGYDLRLRPAQPPTPAADAFEIHRGRGGRRPLARLRAGGRGRVPAAVDPRLPGDQARLVAQHRAPRRRRLRGHRPRPPGPRRLGPLRRRHLRPRHLQPRPLRPGARRARPRALWRGGRRCRRGGGRRHGQPLRGLRGRALLLRHGAADAHRRLRRRRHRPRHDHRHRRRAHRRLPPAAGPGARRARRRAVHARPCAGRGSPPCTAPACGRRPARSPPTTSTS